MTSTPLTQSLKPLAQRRRDMADRIAELQGQLRMSSGIKVITCCSCGHAACGDPIPETLPSDAWVVLLGCKREAPKQVSPAAIEEQIAASAPLTPQQRRDHEALLALTAKFESEPKPSTSFVTITR